jgi:hypothetical protein
MGRTNCSLIVLRPFQAILCYLEISELGKSVKATHSTSLLHGLVASSSEPVIVSTMLQTLTEGSVTIHAMAASGCRCRIRLATRLDCS